MLPPITMRGTVDASGHGLRCWVPEMTVEIAPVGPADDLADILSLIRDYADTLQPGPRAIVQREFAGFPMHFAAPEGILLVARDGEGRPVGCVAFRKSSERNTCEMKRLIVRADVRGLGVGRALISMAERAAVDAGYSRIELGTFPDMAAAQHIYLSADFHPSSRGGSGKMEGLMWFEKDLSPPTTAPVPGATAE